MPPMPPTLHLFNSYVVFTHFSQLTIFECRIFFFSSFVTLVGHLLMHTTPLAANQIKIDIRLFLAWRRFVGIYYASHWVNGKRTFFFGHEVWGGMALARICDAIQMYFLFHCEIYLSFFVVVDPFDGCVCVILAGGAAVIALANSDLSTKCDLCRGKDMPLSIRIRCAINIGHLALPLKWEHTFADVQFVFAVVHMMALSHVSTCVQKTVL